MNSSNAAVQRNTEHSLEVATRKPQLHAVKVTKIRNTNLPKLSLAEALKDAIQRTG